jgi:hypothetical protein
LGEPVLVRLTLDNVGSKNVLVNKSFHLNYQVWLKVTGPGGKEEEWCGILPEWVIFEGDFVLLAPGAHVTGVVRADCGGRERCGYTFPAPGRYSIIADYGLPWDESDLKKIAGSALIVREVFAKPIQVTVLPAEKWRTPDIRK